MQSNINPLTSDKSALYGRISKHNLWLFLAGFRLSGIIAIYQYKIRKPNENDRKF